VRTDAQVASVAALAFEIWNEHYVSLIGQPQVDYMLARFQSAPAIAAQIDEGYEYFLLQRGSELVGYCAVREDRPGRSLFISKLYVRSDARGTGTGRACMEFIEQLASRRGLERLWLTVNKGNPSVNVYRRLGFHVTQDLVMDIGSGFVMDDFRMEKQLCGAGTKGSSPDPTATR
jgi:ribosomal protein S18 acetylase RimI-like enzyme